MKILDADQIRGWDTYTIQHEPISSIDLMERAASRCVAWLSGQGLLQRPFLVFCGKGNNGGDGLAIARMLAARHCQVSVYILEFGHRGTDDFQANLERLHQQPVPIHYIQDPGQFPLPGREAILIDALYGTGLNRPLEGLSADLVNHLNSRGCQIISIDIPSGLPADQPLAGQPAVRATHTLTFQGYKLAFLVAENAPYIGQPVVLDIGLAPAYYESQDVTYELTDLSRIRLIYRPRSRFAHKGQFGHALLLAGSYGKIGAAVLAARACLRGGAGLLTCQVPSCGYGILQTSLPEAMVMTDFNSSVLTRLEGDLSRFDAVGVGPGIGTARETRSLVRDLISSCRAPLVLDADALNSLAANPEWLALVPSGSLLTPHPKEFDRLFGDCPDDFARLDKALRIARDRGLVVILKGHHTLVATPGGKGFFNPTGNPGMATAGSGDVLTGLLTGLLAQGYGPVEAALLGVYLHGLAGDAAASARSEEALIAGDIVEYLGTAYRQLREPA
ncbi:MAG TPA: NAD(P)H-hydrate dehydratase [Chitinophagaceae bacterium]|nr:NAD(P)H-hydrate dehydratase [Chitinophagaceae bacterium]